MPRKSKDKQEEPSSNIDIAKHATGKRTIPWVVVFIIFLFAPPIGIILLFYKIAQDYGLSQKFVIRFVVGFLIVLIVTGAGYFIKVKVEEVWAKEEHTHYNIVLEGVKDGVFSTNCNVISGTKKCKTIEINGTYTFGEQHLKPKIQPSEDENDKSLRLDLRGDNAFTISYDTSVDDSSLPDHKKSLEIYFDDYKTNPGKFYNYGLIIEINLSEEDLQKIKEYDEEQARKAEEEKRKVEEEAARKAEEEERQKTEAEAKRQEEANRRQTTNHNSSNDSGSRSSSPLLRQTLKSGYELIVESATGDTITGLGHIRGRIRNTSSRDLIYAYLEFGIYNSSGAKVSSCSDAMYGLKAGIDWEFDILCYGWDKGTKIKGEDYALW